MAYNITNWRTEEIRQLSIPLRALYDLDEELIDNGWAPKPPKLDPTTCQITIDGCDGLSIVGSLDTLEDPLIRVEEICLYGEGSGYFMHHVLEPALKKSTGFLQALLCWEGGDHIETIKVTNGRIELIPL